MEAKAEESAVGHLHLLQRLQPFHEQVLLKLQQGHAAIMLMQCAMLICNVLLLLCSRANWECDLPPPITIVVEDRKQKVSHLCRQNT